MTNTNTNPALSAFRLALLAANRCVAAFDALPAETRALPAFRAARAHYISEEIKARRAWHASLSDEEIEVRRSWRASIGA